MSLTAVLADHDRHLGPRCPTAGCVWPDHPDHPDAHVRIADNGSDVPDRHGGLS